MNIELAQAYINVSEALSDTMLALQADEFPADWELEDYIDEIISQTIFRAKVGQ